MGRILAVVFGLTLLGFLGYKAMYGSEAPASPEGTSVPKRSLENARGAATRIENNEQKRADDIEAKTRE